jgi:ATP-dependent DNA ligase
VLLGVDGVSDFDGLHSCRHDDDVQFYAFDMLVSDGEDLRKLPLTLRKANLARLLARLRFCSSSFCSGDIIATSTASPSTRRFVMAPSVA